MNIEDLIPNEPKQKRSKARYKEILDTVENIIASEGLYSVTIKNVSKFSESKRPSIYKLFPSNESLFYGLSLRHIEKFTELYRHNTEKAKVKEIEWYLNVFVDLLSIYLNQNKSCANLFFYLNTFPKARGISQQNKRLLATNIFEVVNKKKIEVDSEKIYISCQISLSLLATGFNEENLISPRYLNETKKAVSAYLATN
tara:strand:+ start:27621 stop:28217 length:597 start_codon:yes stop_codon:yes gene_type:complete